ncbi:MAG: GTP 3',8-cyclase MoaA [Deltaproteobacteria bacterium]|nr:GTP 3',8-cyclase MoaA [Deltaproteobacteria bacterium]
MKNDHITEKDNRTVNYLRLSVTDRCNLRCIYCMPDEGIDFIPHGEILSYEEMLHLVSISLKAGIRKVRLTGGEPLVRKDCLAFVDRLCQTEGLEEITLTTNGVLLKEYASGLRDCGICRINVSMDTLRAERFLQIARRDYFDRVWEGIREAERLGFSPIKINVVAMRGINDDEILDFAKLTLDRPYHIRFIEFMPIGENNGWTSERFISTKEIYERIAPLGDLRPIGHHGLDGPAQRYALEGAKGELGFIGALTNHFCHNCNRLRLTSEGHLRGCLLSDHEIDLKGPMREGKGDEHLLQLINHTIENKPRSHGLMKSGPRKCVRQMSSIGG